jgi:hypothetical protein
VPTLDAALIAEEDALWHDLSSTIHAFTPEQVLVSGYFREGWTAKDGLAHIGTWLAEAGAVLEQIRFGTYEELPRDRIDGMNEEFLTAMRDMPLADVKAQAASARSMMLHAWGALPANDPIAEDWIRKSGPDHYREHIPRLHEWLHELQDAAADADA